MTKEEMKKKYAQLAYQDSVVREEMKDIRTEYSWYVIDGDEHLKMGSFEDAQALMEARARIGNAKQLIMMSDAYYSTWSDRKTKRGKKS